MMPVGILTELLTSACQVRVRIAWGADINADPTTWVWTDVTADVQQENDKYINISPLGRPPESKQTPPATAVMTFDNRANLYSKNNPLCPNWPNVRQYTPLQTQLTIDSGVNWWTVFQGEISDWKPAWDSTGNYAVTIVTAKGRIQRENQHSNPLHSRLYTKILSGDAPYGDPIAYWNLEDGPNTINSLSPMDGVHAMVRKYSYGTAYPLPSFGTYTKLAPGTGPGPSFKNGGTLTAPVIGSTAVTDIGWCVEFALDCGSSYGNTTLFTVITIETGPDFWELVIDTVGKNWTMNYQYKTAPTWTKSGVGSGSWTSTSSPFNGQTNLIAIGLVTIAAGNTQGYVIVHNGDSGDKHMFYFSGAVGVPVRPITNITLGNNGTSTDFEWSITHVGTWNDSTLVATPGFGGVMTNDTDVHRLSLYGDTGTETPNDRMTRLSLERNVPFTTLGYYDSSMLMGPQIIASFMDNMRKCERTDDGFMLDGLDAGIAYQNVSQRYDQNAAITLPITDIANPVSPLDNDLNAINTVKVTREKGSSVTTARTTGILGTGADGIGPIGGQIDISNDNDDVLIHRANWETWKGTIAGFRYPMIKLDILSRPSIAAKWMARTDGYTGPVMPGCKLVITSPASYASQHPIENIELCIESLAMRISRYKWQIDLMCSNHHQYDVNKIDDDNLGNIETAGSVLASPVLSGANTLIVNSIEESLWSTAGGDYSKYIYVDGVKCTLSGVAHAATDTYQRVVANGWGTPDTSPTGAAYTAYGGVAADFSTTGNYGRHSNNSVNVARYTVIDSECIDCDLWVQHTLNVGNPSGAGIITMSLARFTDVNNYYTAYLNYAVTTGIMTLVLAKNVAGVLTTINTSAALSTSHVLGAPYIVRFLLSGTSLKAKAWINTATEPPWQVTGTDSTITSGTMIGLGSKLLAGNTNPLPVTTDYDDLSLRNPQMFTITGLTKDIDPTLYSPEIRNWISGVLRL